MPKKKTLGQQIVNILSQCAPQTMDSHELAEELNVLPFEVHSWYSRAGQNAGVEKVRKGDASSPPVYRFRPDFAGRNRKNNVEIIDGSDDKVTIRFTVEIARRKLKNLQPMLAIIAEA